MSWFPSGEGSSEVDCVLVASFLDSLEAFRGEVYRDAKTFFTISGLIDVISNLLRLALSGETKVCLLSISGSIVSLGLMSII